MIKQSSGEDWISTKISFSTATPSKGGAPPTLQANNIRIYRPPPPRQYYGDGMRLERAKSMQKESVHLWIPTISLPHLRS